MKLWHAVYAVPVTGTDDNDDAIKPRIVEDDFYMPSPVEVRRYILSRGAWPIEIKQRAEATVTFLETRSVAWQLQLLRSLRFQTVNASAGTALLQIIESEADPRRKIAALPARTVLKAGGTFSEALKAMRLFDATTQAIITAGERSNDMREVISYAVTHIEDRVKQMRTLKNAMGWLAFDIVSMMSTLIGTQFGYIPYLRSSGMASQNKVQVEKFQSAIDTASLINGSLMWGTIGLTVACTVVGVSFVRNKDKTDHWAARSVRMVPLFGTYLLAQSMSDTSKNLSRLARSGVPVDEALAIVEASALSPQVRSYWSRAREKIRGGTSPQKALAAEPLTRVEQSQVATYETIEQLADVFDAISEERTIDAKAGQRRIIQAGIGLLFLLFGAVAAITVWLVTLQNEGMLETIKSLRA